MRPKQKAMLVLAAAGVVAGIAFAQKTLQLFINGKPAKAAIVQGNETYVPLSALKAAGVPIKTSGSRIDLTLAAANASDAVAGTTQLAGGVGELGKTQTIGQRSPLNFTLRSAEFSVKRIDIGPTKFAPEVKEKLLVLRFSVQNPQKQDVDFGTTAFQFTAVDSKDINVSPEPYGTEYVARDGEVVPLRVKLKPAQKIDAYAVLVVSGAGVIPKLIVQRTGENTAPVLRYDLTSKVKALPAPYNDPADPSGATALTQITVQPGVFVPTRFSSLRLDSGTFSNEKFEGREAGENKRFLVLGFTIKNDVVAGGAPLPVGYCSFGLVLTASDDESESVERCGANLYKASRDERLNLELAAAAETKFRVIFAVPNDVTGKTLAMTEEQGRMLRFDLSSFK